MNFRLILGLLGASFAILIVYCCARYQPCVRRPVDVEEIEEGEGEP